jgi:hypothetical protein
MRIHNHISISPLFSNPSETPSSKLTIPSSALRFSVTDLYRIPAHVMASWSHCWVVFFV